MDLIIGAGVSGLSYAGFSNENYLIIEKESEIGGYCRTIKKDGFVWDYSGHFFHFRNDEIKKYILERMDPSEILDVDKHSQIYIDGIYVDFPFQKNIHQLEKNDFLNCLVDLFSANDIEVKNFKDMLYAKYGKSISDMFLIPYNEKLYACDLNILDKDAMGRFFPHADKFEIVKNFVNPDNVSYNSKFTYPKGGAIEYVRSLESRIDRSKISLNHSLLSIDREKKVAITNKGNIKFDRLISTMPLPTLLEKCDIQVERGTFSWNKVLVFNLGFDKKGDDVQNHWVYFPERDISFYRIGYYDNIFGDDRLSLYVEIGLGPSEDVNEEERLEIVLNDLRKINIISDHNLISHVAIVMNPAYVHVNANSEIQKKTYKDELSKSGIYSIGRYGDWKYCSIEDNIIEAKNLHNSLK